MQGVKKDLELDIECYTCGETPSPLEMLRAPQIDNWKVLIRRHGKEFVLVVEGVVSKHHEIPDGEPIRTSPVVWCDRHRRWVRTYNRLYSLGGPAEVPLEEL
jgi:hypothetical protein